MWPLMNSTRLWTAVAGIMGADSERNSASRLKRNGVLYSEARYYLGRLVARRPLQKFDFFAGRGYDENTFVVAL